MRVALSDSFSVVLCQSFEALSKDAKRCSSLQRHHSIACAAKGIGSALVHQIGHAINQHTKAGFNRRCKVRRVGDNASPVF